MTSKIAQINEIVRAVFYGVPVEKVMGIMCRARELVERCEATIGIEA